MGRPAVAALAFWLICATASGLKGAIGVSALGPEDSVLSIDHRVSHVSTIPAIAGETVELYVREKVLPGSGRPIVLMVHAAFLSLDSYYDLPVGDYSWMDYLARAGFDVFALDLTGVGLSPRPPQIDDPCNATEAQQAPLIPGLMPAACQPTYPFQLATIGADVDQIDATVDYVRTLRGVSRIHLLAHSRGVQRAGMYVASRPEKIDRLVLQGASYERATPSEPPQLPAPGVPLDMQTWSMFETNWRRQVDCQGQLAPSVADSVRGTMFGLDPTGAAWGPGMLRAPTFTTWGWNAEAAALVQTPTLIIEGELDNNSANTNTERAMQLFEDLGSAQKLFVDVACTSHYAAWESNHLLVFQAAAEWLNNGTVNGVREGSIRIGD